MDPQPHPPASAPPYGPQPPHPGPSDFSHGPPPPGTFNPTLPYRPHSDVAVHSASYYIPGPPSEGISSYHTGPGLPPASTQQQQQQQQQQPPPPSSFSANPAHTNKPPASPPPLTHAPPIPIPDPAPRPAHSTSLPHLAAATAGMPPPTTSSSALGYPEPMTSTRLSDARAGAEAALREYMNLQRQRAMVNGVGGVGVGVGVAGIGMVNGSGGKFGGGEAAGVEERLRAQAGIVLGRLRGLKGDVGGVVGEGEGQRWRRFLVGGIVASVIPIVKALFRRPRDDDESSNDTEYAFRKSKRLIARVLAATRRPGIATVAFFVFAVLYVFQNEVSLRAGRSVQKRLKRLTAKVENGTEDITEEDLKLLKGWRWRVLMWTS
ncbi:hypothetical protein MFIFM68171_08873 [Madurella fahalii]|uniref:Uncharacterized protein n=1 Tax=Madurella fahalii TaxID=1157608 RepID=A0ABQ0GLL7_9PEZI